jgi:hypothetical protein
MMKSLFKMIFVLAIIMTAVIPTRAKDTVKAKTKTVEVEQKPLVYYWVKGTPACISEQLLDNFISAMLNNDTQSMTKYLKNNICHVNKKAVKITMIDQGFNQAKFLYQGITFFAKNTAINHK